MPLPSKAWLVALALLVPSGLTAGCGGDDEDKAPPAPTAPAPAANIVKQADVQGIPLGTPEAKIVKLFGEPVGRPANKAQSCLVYATDAGPDTWQRFCFVDGKLASVATVIGRQNALTLDPPAIEGPGKLEQPKRTKPKK